MNQGIVPQQVLDRLVSLEQQVRQLEADARQRERTNTLTRDRHIFLAKTGKTTSYPSDPANTYEIFFLDGTYTKSAGLNFATYTNHSAAPHAYAYSPSNVYYAEGSVVAVYEYNERYWIVDAGGASSSSFRFRSYPLDAATTGTISYNTTTDVYFSTGDGNVDESTLGVSLDSPAKSITDDVATNYLVWWSMGFILDLTASYQLGGIRGVRGDTNAGSLASRTFVTLDLNQTGGTWRGYMANHLYWDGSSTSQLRLQIYHDVLTAEHNTLKVEYGNLIIAR